MTVCTSHGRTSLPFWAIVNDRRPFSWKMGEKIVSDNVCFERFDTHDVPFHRWIYLFWLWCGSSMVSSCHTATRSKFVFWIRQEKLLLWVFKNALRFRPRGWKRIGILSRTAVVVVADVAPLLLPLGKTWKNPNCYRRWQGLLFVVKIPFLRQTLVKDSPHTLQATKIHPKISHKGCLRWKKKQKKKTLDAAFLCISASNVC